MLFKYLSNQQVLAISTAFLVFLIAAFFTKKEKYSLALIVVGNFILCFTIANIDKFLNLWDEQFHALVAKNLIDHPLKPVLIKNTYLPFLYDSWKSNHIWLHKPPLFLWQIALSIALFGKTAIAVRIPSILMHSIIPIFIYRIGKISNLSKGSVWGALFFSIAFFPIAVASGKFATDHNDMAFLFYMTASFWAWFEYQESGKKRYLILIGIFSGFAVLTKWLMGLFVFVMWAAYLVVFKGKNLLKKDIIIPPFLAFIPTLLIVLPWHIYTRIKYPIEYLYESKLNGSHFIQAVEGHGGNFFYHFEKGFDFLYGESILIPFLIALSVIYTAIRIPNPSYRFAFLFILLFIYLFFSLAATKLVSFTLVVSPLIFLAIGELLSALQFLSHIKINNSIITGFTIGLGLAFSIYLFQFDKMADYFTLHQPTIKEREMELHEYEFIKKLPFILPDDDYVIFNASITKAGYIPIMFFTDYSAYHFIPDAEQVQLLKDAGKKIAIIDRGDLTDSIKVNPDFLILSIK